MTTRQVPHGSVDEVMLTMQEFYASIALNDVAVDDDRYRRHSRGIPGPRGERYRGRTATACVGDGPARKRGKVAQDLFEARVCIVCHEVVRNGRPGGGRTTSRGMSHRSTSPRRGCPRRRFDHDRHRTYKCADCHDKVARSAKSTDVSDPGHRDVPRCHAGNERAAKRESFDLRRVPRIPLPEATRR